jgi:hypothetical protein
MACLFLQGRKEKKMKRFLLVAATVHLTVALCATATPTVNVGYANGTYLLTPNSELGAIIGSNDPFASFCIEKFEPMVIGATYAAALNDEAIKGNGNLDPPGPDGGDLISPETAYLYTQFRAGTLSGYTGSGSAAALQAAIWYLEAEWDPALENATTAYLALSPVAKGFVLDAQTSGWTDIGNVRVLNLTDVNNSKMGFQDMLVLVPAPGALLLGAIGVGLIGWYRQRRRP